jgi:hypothetical protein
VNTYDGGKDSSGRSTVSALTGRCLVGDVVYVSKVKVVRHKGPVREAFLPARKDAVTFGVHSEVAEHYGVDPGDSPPDATTLDYVVAAACG